MTDRASLSSQRSVWTQPLQFEDQAYWTMDQNISASFPKESKACICRFAYLENIHHNMMDKRHNRLFHVPVLYKKSQYHLLKMPHSSKLSPRKGVTLTVWH